MTEFISEEKLKKLLGRVHYGPVKCEEPMLHFRRSLFIVKDIKKGEVFTEENIRSIRPAYGLMPKYLKYTLGRKSTKNIERGTPLKRSHIKNFPKNIKTKTTF